MKQSLDDSHLNLREYKPGSFSEIVPEPLDQPPRRLALRYPRLYDHGNDEFLNDIQFQAEWLSRESQGPW